jgi:hypothetical protein
MMNWQHVRLIPEGRLRQILPMVRQTATTHPLQTSIVVCALLLAIALIMRALWRRSGKRYSESTNLFRNGPFSRMTPDPKANATVTSGSPSPSEARAENPPLDLTLLNPEQDSGVAVYGFTPGDVSPETNAPMRPEQIGSEFFFLKERIANVERKLEIRTPKNGGYGFPGG